MVYAKQGVHFICGGRKFGIHEVRENVVYGFYVSVLRPFRKNSSTFFVKFFRKLNRWLNCYLSKSVIDEEYGREYNGIIKTTGEKSDEFQRTFIANQKSFSPNATGTGRLSQHFRSIGFKMGKRNGLAVNRIPASNRKIFPLLRKRLLFRIRIAADGKIRRAARR